MSEFDPKRFANQLNDLLAEIPDDLTSLNAIRKTQRSQITHSLRLAAKRLEALYFALDPIRQPAHVFDPSDPKRVGELIARTLLLQTPHSLPAIDDFYGSGIYALYYSGDLPVYAPIRGLSHPIYVGKADPAKHDATTVEEQGTRLAVRLRDHKKSISLASNLDVAEFSFRYLVVKSAWQKPAEDYLIDRLRPVWNLESKVCYGFGKHGDNAKTRANSRSPWDTLHPGRPWAHTNDATAGAFGAEEIIDQIRRHFEKFPPASLS